MRCKVSNKIQEIHVGSPILHIFVGPFHIEIFTSEKLQFENKKEARCFIFDKKKNRYTVGNTWETL